MIENLDLFDFKLNDQEMEYLATFDDPKYNTRSFQEYERALKMFNLETK